MTSAPPRTSQSISASSASRRPSRPMRTTIVTGRWQIHIGQKSWHIIKPNLTSPKEIYITIEAILHRSFMHSYFWTFFSSRSFTATMWRLRELIKTTRSGERQQNKNSIIKNDSRLVFSFFFEFFDLAPVFYSTSSGTSFWLRMVTRTVVLYIILWWYHFNNFAIFLFSPHLLLFLVVVVFKYINI